MSLAKDRFYRRLEKVLVTLECALVGGFAGVCMWFVADPMVNRFQAAGITAILTFAIVIFYKRYCIAKERS